MTSETMLGESPAQARLDRIAELNDLLRRESKGGKTVMSEGVLALPPVTLGHVALAVGDFAAFTAQDDPNGEHAAGQLTVDGCGIFFQVEYYDMHYRDASKDPADPEVTRRVMTIGLAEEYAGTVEGETRR